MVLWWVGCRAPPARVATHTALQTTDHVRAFEPKYFTNILCYASRQGTKGNQRATKPMGINMCNTSTSRIQLRLASVTRCPVLLVTLGLPLTTLGGG